MYILEQQACIRYVKTNGKNFATGRQVTIVQRCCVRPMEQTLANLGFVDIIYVLWNSPKVYLTCKLNIHCTKINLEEEIKKQKTSLAQKHKYSKTTLG